MAKRHKLVTAFVGAVAATSLLASCTTTGSTDPSANPEDVTGEVTMWVYPYIDEAAWWADEVEKFNEDYPNIDLEVVVQPWADRDTQITTAIAGGQAPDLVYFIPDQIGQYASQGVLADVSDVIPDWSVYTEPAVEGVSYDGTIYALPILQSVSSRLIYKPAWEAAGITEYPTTWDEALADAPALKDAGYYLVDYYGDAGPSLNLTFYPLLWQAGGDVLSEDGTECTLDSKEGVKAIEFLQTIFENGWADSTYLTTGPDQNAPLQRGLTAMTMSTASGTLVQSGIEPGDDWLSLPPLKDEETVTYGAVGSLGLLEGSPNKEAAKVFLQWFSQPEITREYNLDRTYFSPIAADTGLYEEGTLQAGEEKQLDLVKTGVSAPNARQIMDLIKPQVQAALLGQLSPEDALAKACTDVEGILQR
ncbi:ABC transporter substrate-binding protein [Salinibacterium soli]|uniref:Sugar ABC transporter substrate-binding protein n=1 Tax=Antiquaquibacter soli TaxID=3064523 RepID=A0ABT9BNN6_9MICO|nr:sugar ABC transporter substrate-binding protein [Protaetiibacter sp. WY-16]MDO7882630.1 sugar ABC transporter substrate-binding protein [Protaetiibacter sp. WY-16]